MGSTNSNAGEKTPRLVPGIELRSLPIGPEEAFVLSRVDGRLGASDIAAATGLPNPRVQQVLERLAMLGAIAIGEAPTVTLEWSKPPPEEDAVRPSRLTKPIVETGMTDGAPGQPPTAALYDPTELDEAVDLDMPRRRAILDLYYRLEGLSHYAVLQVAPTADKKEIKGAYYEIVGAYHPDKYFGKKLGSFKPKLERIFARITEAHDVLTRKQTRDEYDRYLETQRKNLDIERSYVDENAHAAELERVRRRIEQEALMAERTSAAAVPPPLQRTPVEPDFSRPSQPEIRMVSTPEYVSPNPVAGATSAARTTNPPSAERTSPLPSHPSVPEGGLDEARRRALARRLMRSSIPPRGSLPPPPSVPPASPSTIRDAVTRDLRRRYEQRVVDARKKQLQDYVRAAEEALAAKNFISAANALKIAASLAPEDRSLSARLEDVRQRANAELADSFLEQARYEEQHQRWAEAAKSYERVALGKPSAKIYERLAFCLLEARGDLKLAGDYARRAVSLAVDVAGHRVTLARVYLAAGMRQSAIAEFERAQSLAPDDDTIRSWLKRIRRNEI